MNLLTLKNLIFEAEAVLSKTGKKLEDIPVFVGLDGESGKLLPFEKPIEDISGLTYLNDRCDEFGNPIENDGHPDEITCFVLANYQYITED